MGKPGHTALALLVCFGAACSCEDEPAPVAAPVAPAPAAAAPVEEDGPRIVDSRGHVEVRRSGGVWGPAVVGQPIARDDSVRTLYNGSAELAVNQVRLKLDEHSELQVQSLAQEGFRAKVKGRVESDATRSRGFVELQPEGSDALVRAEGGHFSMTADGRGVVAVAAVTGSVNLAASGKSVEIKAGQVSRVLPGRKGPSTPTAALTKVLLAVDWPESKETNRRRLALAGRVTPGTRVLVQGELAEVKPDGTFRTRLSLGTGRQRVNVTAVDVTGRRSDQEQTLLVDDRPPNVRLKEPKW